MTDETTRRALQTINACNDPKQLRRIADNARALDNVEVERAAILKLYEVLPSAEPGTVEHDVWRSIHALEDALSTERAKTTRLSRTRQKIGRDGEVKTVADLIAATKPSDGFKMLMERGMPQLTFEAVSLRHPDMFDRATLTAASARLAAEEG